MGTSLLLLLAVAGLGTPVAARLGAAQGLPVATRAALAPLAGLAAVGAVTLAVGHAGLLGAWLPFALGGAGGVALVLARRSCTALVRGAVGAALEQARAFPVPVGAVALGLVLAAVAALAPPWRTDEVEYHWPAPVAWAQAGGWNDSPYRHVDAFPFMEVIYTAAATQGSWVAAHHLHLLTLVATGLAAAGCARSLGVRGSGAVAAAAMAMPVVWDGAYVAYNDVVVGALGATAVAVVLGPRWSTWPAVATAAALLAVAISVKPTAAAGVGVVALVLLLRTVQERGAQTLAPWALLRRWAVLAGTAVLVLGLWSLRQRSLTGHLLDPAVTGPTTAEAASRLPSATEQLLAPVVPLVTGVLGSQEPWGGRTAVVLQLLLVPALVHVLRRRGDTLRRFTLVALPAWAHWVVLGLVTVRTRFHIVTWVLLVVAVRAAVEDASENRPRLRGWLEVVWTLAVVAGMLDVSLEMVRLIGARVW
ncbi:hypothetical protein GCM10022262_18130 [Georgenia daeguensis]|uniref:Glycosyltransferase RgtA/B/C/D-like domain-containing protein n=1 Tax=Georgenia daeguensis TaxID=908355 RepID=A0ABP8ETZ1_9MICO